MSGFQTIPELLSEQAKQTPEAIAIQAPNRTALTYLGLKLQTDKVAKFLKAIGISSNDRVAIILPNGPEMATAFLGVACCATSAPLNPAYRASEFDFYLSDLNAKAILVQSNIKSPARECAQTLGIPVIEISIDKEKEAGVFTIPGDDQVKELDVEYSNSDDIALVLHTSGTTSKPKIVPLTQANVCASAHNIKATLQLAAQDSCLNIMPLFHIHGLMAALLSSLYSGANVICTPGFQVDPFFDELATFQPSWYTAVPTMHQAILSKAQAVPNLVEGVQLRFLRSSSASLPPMIMEGLVSHWR